MWAREKGSNNDRRRDSRGQERMSIRFLERDDGPRLAYRRSKGRGPTLVFLPGYASDMDGTKAVALDAFAAKRGLPMLRFDYSGTGSSEGAFEDGTLARWTDEALLMLDRLTEGSVVLVGSSMGGWVALAPCAAPAGAGRGVVRHRRRARLHRVGLSRSPQGSPRRQAKHFGVSFQTAEPRSRRADFGLPARRCDCSNRKSRSTAPCA